MAIVKDKDTVYILIRFRAESPSLHDIMGVFADQADAQAQIDLNPRQKFSILHMVIK